MGKKYTPDFVDFDEFYPFIVQVGIEMCPKGGSEHHLQKDFWLFIYGNFLNLEKHNHERR